MQITDTIYAEFAKTTQNWCKCDDEHRWITNNNNQSTRIQLQTLGWTSDNVTYKFNAHGFRAEEFVDEGVMFLGCSHTMGIGMSWEHTWAWLVAKELGLKCWNLGIGGGSNDTAFRNAYNWIPVLQPKYVFLLSPPHNRMEILKHERIEQYLPSTNSDELYIDWLLGLHNSKLNVEKNTLAIKHICMKHNIPLIHFDDQYFRIGVEKGDLARDLIHNGRIWNKNMAKTALDKIRA